MRRYQRAWMADRRGAWMAGKACAACGSSEDLELDHIDPSGKVSARIWSWASERRNLELAKCQPLCHGCHKAKTRRELLAKRAAITRCKRDHPYSGFNLQFDRRGNRVCRECRRMRRHPGRQTVVAMLGSGLH
jgi:5-methylcytosine-specific restriction endonuclease McrA